MSADGSRFFGQDFRGFLEKIFAVFWKRFSRFFGHDFRGFLDTIFAVFWKRFSRFFGHDFRGFLDKIFEVFLPDQKGTTPFSRIFFVFQRSIFQEITPSTLPQLYTQLFCLIKPPAFSVLQLNTVVHPKK
jgi:hypothetical protein